MSTIKFLRERAAEMHSLQPNKSLRDCLLSCIDGHPDYKLCSQKSKVKLADDIIKATSKEAAVKEEAQETMSLEEWIKTDEALKGARQNAMFHQFRVKN
jgi:hypothetical protein